MIAGLDRAVGDGFPHQRDITHLVFRHFRHHDFIQVVEIKIFLGSGVRHVRTHKPYRQEEWFFVVLLKLIHRPIRDQFVEHLAARHIRPIQSPPAQGLAAIKIVTVVIDDLTAFVRKRVELGATVATAACS